MDCLNCNGQMTCSTEQYQYTAAGMDNVWLNDIEICRCSCGERAVTLPAISKLHRVIGRTLLEKDSLLSGQEIRYLRRAMRLTGKAMASLLRVTNETVSRWEHGKVKTGYGSDIRLRLLYAEKAGINIDEKLIGVFLGVEPVHSGNSRVELKPEDWLSDKSSPWKTAASPRNVRILRQHSKIEVAPKNRMPSKASGEWRTLPLSTRAVA